ncbi:hypothetical protein EHQ76_09935 [Leptospira barantonii]|uniref:Uncharacterized protein n=1 Tax=Leptospira barantonii TaxID=2023184 RepID=A0A5F2BD60_9LEPT|nr:hypothetical protein [Leptospira barantonii]TGM03519.1 hypothetical protein EHQ76_09935 [Leptospira barantonii]
MRLTEVYRTSPKVLRRISILSIWICCSIHSSCRSLESFLESVILTAGVDSTKLTFSTSYSPLQEFVRSSGGTKDPANADRTVNQDPFKSVPFYTIGSIPRRLSATPFTGYFKILNYMAYSFSFIAPRTFRGNLLNFPDDGRIPTNFTEHTLYGLYPLPEPFGRKAEYLYIDYQFYATLYLAFLQFQNWNVGLGFNLGASIYDFDVLEKEVRVSSSRNKHRVISGVRFLYEYNIGQYFEDSIFYNTYLYFEFSSLGSLDRDPIKQTIPTSLGGTVPDLYLTMDTYRVGVRKEIQLSRPTSDDLLRKDSGPGNESSPPKQTEPVPPRI